MRGYAGTSITIFQWLSLGTVQPQLQWKPQTEELWFVRTTGGKALTAVLLIETSCHSSRVITPLIPPTDQQATKSSLLQSKITSLLKQMTFLLSMCCCSTHIFLLFCFSKSCWERSRPHHSCDTISILPPHSLWLVCDISVSPQLLLHPVLKSSV